MNQFAENASTPPLLSKEQQNAQIQIALQQGFQEIFMRLVQFINNLRFNNEDMKRNFFLNIDQARYWALSGIQQMSFDFDKKKEDSLSNKKDEPSVTVNEKVKE